jgi:hypothetical protein
MTRPEPMTLDPLGVLTMDMDTTILRGGPMGTRVIVEFRNVTLEGARLRGKQRGATSADWLVVGADATATLDIRIVLDTDDGAVVYLHGAGRTNANEFPKGGPIWFTPIFETADARYAWLNAVQCVAKGRADGPRATFDVAIVT